MSKRGFIADQYPSSEGEYTDLQVLHSAAGYYIGTIFLHNKTSEFPGLQEPGSRESDYYRTKEAAQKELDAMNWDQRGSPDEKKNPVMFELDPD